MTLKDLEHKHIIIYGYGAEGRAAFEVLSAQDFIENIDIIDDADIPEVTLTSAEAIKKAGPDTVVLRSPGIPLNNPTLTKLKEKGAHITSGTNLFLAEQKGKGAIIGITGSKGKSTTASLLHHVLGRLGKDSRLIGNIGDPAISHIHAPKGTIFVFELSSYQLEDITTAPDIATIINIFPDAHLKHHNGYDGYLAAKSRITLTQTEDDLFIYNPDFSDLKSLSKHTKATALRFPDQTEEIKNHLNLPGTHFARNACAIIKMAGRLKLDRSAMIREMESFKGLPHRLQNIGTYKGITFINDSISTLPGAGIAGIKAIGNDLGGVILGGQDEGYDYKDLANLAASIADSAIIYTLPGGKKIDDLIKKAGGRTTPVPTVEDAIKDAYKNLAQGTSLLLSPAAPSFDQFENYKNRGDLFGKWAREHAK